MTSKQSNPNCPTCQYPMAFDFWAGHWVCVYEANGHSSVSTVPGDKGVHEMTTPTEAELFADLLEYRAVIDILRAFDAGHVVNIMRTRSDAVPEVAARYRMTINKIGCWEVLSDSFETLQQAAEQARERAVAEIANEPFVRQAKAALSGIVVEQIAAELNSAIHGRLLEGRR